MMYEVATHYYGRRLITRDGPCQGLLEWPEHKWERITARPLGLKRAIALADAQPTHATVQAWMTADVVHSNGRTPMIPIGWYPPDATMARQRVEPLIGEGGSRMVCCGEVK
jgi:hypothetical protein